MKLRGSKLSPKARVVWDEVDERQRRIIQKSYPLRKDRDDAIRELSARGVTVLILSELTGLSPVQIIRIRRAKMHIITLPLKKPVKIFEHSIVIIPD